MAQLVADHLKDNVAHGAQYSLRCAMCTNPMCGKSREFFAQFAPALQARKNQADLKRASQG
jgi:hypothetical protein